MKRHTRSQFARERKYSTCVYNRGLKMLLNRHKSTRIEQLVTTNDNPLYWMSICKTLRKYSASVCEGGGGVVDVVESTRFNLNRRTHHNKWWPVILDVDLQDTANWHLVWWIVICCDELFDLSWIMSNRQHLLHCTVYNILMIDFWLFHALRMWKVHVVMFLYHVTHFHSLLLDIWYVN